MTALKTEYLGALLPQDHLGNCFPRIDFIMLSHPGTRTIADVVQMDPVTALAGDRMWHCPCDTGLAGIQVGLESFWIAPERAVHKTGIVKLKLQ